MANYHEMDRDALTAEKAALEQAYKEFQAKGLKLNMARGKPGPHQMDLAMDLLKMTDYTTDAGTDARNYGELEGLSEARALFADVFGVKPNEVFVGGNSSLQLMYNLINIGYVFGFPESPCPWSQVEKRKFLCPVPGYDRHFAITEEFGFELISVPMTPNGPDMDVVEKLVAEDDTIKGIWCVPQYSNPDGYTYSDETIERFAKMKTAAPDFKIFWDEAYIVHHLTEEIIETPVLLNVSKKYGTQDRVFMFTSTSKITFPGAGVSAIACSDNSMKYMCKRFSVMIISYDKMNQLRHVRFLKNKEGVLAHMAKHRRRLVPCFDAVKTAFAANLTPCGDIAHWTNPKGGYFISLYVMPGCAKRVAELCKNAGLVLTGAGSAYPYHKDPQDSHLRIAPTYPSLDEVETASELLCVCVRLAVVEKLLAEQVQVYTRTNLVQSKKFSEKIKSLMNAYYNGLITNEEVIKELLETAQQMAQKRKEGQQMGLTDEEMAFYDALTRPEAIKDFYTNDQLVAITRELTEALRKNHTIDWQKKEGARAKMRVMIKRLLKKYKYPPEGMEDAIGTVMNQCELWTDNAEE